MNGQVNNDALRVDELGKDFLNFHFPRYDELPRIELYLDQVIGILNETLEPFFEQGEDKIITGAMVNNYVKHKVIASPTKKRYNKSHLCCLFVICILKKVFSITEIGELLDDSAPEEKFERNYNHFCEEVERALIIKFAKSSMAEETRDTESHSELDLGRSMAFAVANKLYVQKIIQSKPDSTAKPGALTETMQRAEIIDVQPE